MQPRICEGDVRTDLPDAQFDLYFSCGVPYSHLTTEDCHMALGQIMRQARSHDRQASLVVDVLGRYSHEWTPRWAQERWNYDMSFFDGDGDDAIDAMMTFYCRSSLTRLLQAAADETGAKLSRLTMDDRSVVAGRHTTTRAFNHALPPYRSLLNRLVTGDTELSFEEIRLQPDLGHTLTH